MELGQPTLDLLHKAAERPVCRFEDSAPPDIFQLNASQRMHLNDFRHAAISLRISAIRMAHLGQIDGAVRNIQTITQLSNHLNQTQPCVLTGVARLGLEELNCGTFIRVLPNLNSTDALPRDLLPDESTLSIEFDHALQGEHALIMGVVVHLARGEPRTTTDRRELLANALLGKAYRLLWLESDVQAVNHWFDRQRDLVLRHPIPQNNLATFRASFLIHLMQPSQRVTDLNTQTIASARQARIALALTNYRLKHGSYPATLHELVPDDLPAVPADPFDGKEMKYRLEAGDAIIYCVGTDHIDHGGKMGEFRGDHGFRLARPAKSH